MKDLVEAENLDKSVKISYDEKGIGNLSEIERESSMAMEEENEY